MDDQFPLAWAYLKGHETALRSRESSAFDNDEWYQFGRSQNIGRQNTAKIIVPRLVMHVACAVDAAGEFYLDNVDVGGIEPARNVSPRYLAAVLNAPAADFAFRRISKPFRGDFRSANKQFIAPLPIPKAPPTDQAALAQDAERLQVLHDQRRQALADIAGRLGAVSIRPRPVEWLFPGLPDLDALKDQAPKRLIGTDRRAWAKERLAKEIEARHATVGEHLKPGVPVAAELVRGELRFLIDGIPAITGIFPPPAEAPFLLAQWSVMASRTEVTDKTTGSKLADMLRKVSPSADAHIMAEVIRLQTSIATDEAEIASLEGRINQTIYRLHKLTREEIALIESAAR